MTQLTVQDSQLAAKWASFFEDYCKAEIQAAAFEFPETRSVVVAFNDLQLRDPDLADYLLQKPGHCLRVGAQMLHQVDVTVDPRPRLHLRVTGLPSSQVVPVRSVRVDHLGRFISVEGLVKKISPVRPRVLEAAYDCKTCGNRVRVVQEDRFETLPVLCDSCEKQGPWQLRTEDSRFIDHQKLELQENPEGLLGGSMAQRLIVHLQDDQAGRLEPGDRVRINGVLVAEQRREGQKGTVDFEKLLQAVSIEVLEATFLDLKLNDQDLEDAKQLASRPDLWPLLVRSFGPVIHGHEDIKEGFLLSLFGSPSEVTQGVRQRGEIHVLVVGDPGLAKSQFLDYAAELAPRAVQANGKTSTSVGLTATAVKEEGWAGAGWTLEAGALVLADNALCTVDEADKMHEEDQASLNEAMEQGRVTINKASVQQQLRARATVQAAANPKGGSFDPNGARLYEQVGLIGSLLSRFDLLYALRDTPDAAKDLAVFLHMGQLHNGQLPPEVEAQELVPPEKMRLYIAVAKRKNPIAPLPVIEHLAKYAVEVRRRAALRGEEGAGFTRRQFQGLMRLAKASARGHLRDEVLVEDAERAIRVFTASWRSIGAVDQDGIPDAAVLTTGLNHDQRSRNKAVEEICRELREASVTGRFREPEVIQAAQAKGIQDAHKALEQLRRDGVLYQPAGPGSLALSKL